MKGIIPTLLLGLTLATPLVLAAPTAEQSAQLEERLSEVRARLELTDDQVARLEPIMAASLDRQFAVLERYGIDPTGAGGGRPNPRTARQLKREMDAVRSETLAQLEEILTAEQLAEFAAIQEERKREMRERMRGGR
jgi:Spy/CpxP family protein refolding chaperone